MEGSLKFVLNNDIELNIICVGGPKKGLVHKLIMIIISRL